MTKDDGLNHQSNLTFEVNTETMKITDSRTGISNTKTGYVSHSFNQFVKIFLTIKIIKTIIIDWLIVILKYYNYD